MNVDKKSRHLSTCGLVQWDTMSQKNNIYYIVYINIKKNNFKINK